MSTGLQRTDAQIMAVVKEIDDAVITLSELDHEAATLRGKFEVAEAKAFLAADGSMEVRKRTAIVATEKVKHELEVAESQLRVHKAFMKSLEQQLDALRSKGAMQRSQWQNEGAGQWT